MDAYQRSVTSPKANNSPQVKNLADQILSRQKRNLWKLPGRFYNNMQKLTAMKEWLYDNNDLPVKELIAKMNKKLIGHYRYYGISFNGKKISAFLHCSQKYLGKALNRRSQMKSYTWDGFIDMLKVYPLAKPKIYVRLF